MKKKKSISFLSRYLEEALAQLAQLPSGRKLQSLFLAVAAATVAAASVNVVAVAAAAAAAAVAGAGWHPQLLLLSQKPNRSFHKYRPRNLHLLSHNRCKSRLYSIRTPN